MNLLRLTSTLEHEKALFHSRTNVAANAVIVPIDLKCDLLSHPSFVNSVAGLIVIESADVTQPTLALITDVTF